MQQLVSSDRQLDNDVVALLHGHVRVKPNGLSRFEFWRHRVTVHIHGIGAFHIGKDRWTKNARDPLTVQHEAAVNAAFCLPKDR